VAPSIRRETGHRRCRGGGAGALAVELPLLPDVSNGPIAGGSDAMFSVPIAAACLLPAGGARHLPHPNKARDATFREMQRPASARGLPGTSEEPGGGCGSVNVGRMQVRLWTDFVLGRVQLTNANVSAQLTLAARAWVWGSRLRAISPRGP
jgi:hypothetical protein